MNGSKIEISKKTFMAGFDAGYALGQFHAGEGGGGWTEPPMSEKAWEEFQKPKKPKNTKNGL